MRRLRESDNKTEAERRRQLELARLRREQRRARREDRFDAAALVLGVSMEHDRK